MTTEVWAQGGPGRKGRGPMHRGGRHDSQFRADRDAFHFLLSNHKDIRRTVTKRDDGVETLTESDDAKIAERIQEHVAAMYKRVEERRPIRRRDLLFDELFRHAGKIQRKLENTQKGVKVVETSRDPYVVRLIQEHARVVSLFVKHGHAEARKNHAIPSAPDAGSWDGKIVQFGKLHEVLGEGRHQARIELGKLTQGVLVKVNTEQMPSTAEQFRIQSIPAVYGFRDGEVRGYFVGLLPEYQKFLRNPRPDANTRLGWKTTRVGDLNIVKLWQCWPKCKRRF